MCEVCGKNEAVFFSVFIDKVPIKKCQWKFCCGCTSDDEFAFMTINSYYHDPELAFDQLKAKNWMTDQSLDEFWYMISRYQGDYNTGKELK